MMKFRDKAKTPPSGFRYRDRDTGMEIDARTWNVFMDKINAHREANNLPAVDQLEVEHQNCGRMSKSAAQMFCASNDPDDIAYEAIRLHAIDIARGTVTIAAFKLSGDPLVSQAEADRRASVCVTCPCNTPFRLPCGGLCGELLEVVKSVTGDAKPEHHEQLHQCAVCKCYLNSKVFFPMDALKNWESEAIHEQYPSWCWMKENGENHLPDAT